MKKKFIPQQWLNNNYSEVDQVIYRIEAACIDIATSYADWVNLGFAFVNEFGEAGRSFFHRVSQFYAGYNQADCDKQFDQCLKASPSGSIITIATFFHLAKVAGVEISGQKGLTINDQRLTINEGKNEVGSDQWSVGRKTGGSDDSSGEATMYRGRTDDPSNDPETSRATIHRGLPKSPKKSNPEDASPEEATPEPALPTLPDEIFERLPEILQMVVEKADSKQERDILLIGAMTAFSSCLYFFSGNYDGKKVYPSIYFYVVAPASSGKGRLILCRNLVNPIHWEKLKQNIVANQIYEVEQREYNLAKGKDTGMEKPQKPPVLVLYIPANNSTTGFYQLLHDNEGRGFIIETEGDTIAQALKTDYGNFSDGLRKAFHQETISYYRRTDREHVEIEHPSLSMILSSTLGQMLSLIPSTENGLASRFLFYYMGLQPIWKDVFAHSGQKTLDDHFDGIGQQFYTLYKALKEKDPIDFSLTIAQQHTFNEFFAQMQDKYLVLQSLDYMAIIRRLGLIAFRIMMVLTALRIPETGDFSPRQECSDVDFQSTLSIIQVLVRHASHIVSKLPEEVKTEKRANKKEKFYEALGERFNRQEYLVVAKTLEISDRTAQGYIAKFCEKGLIFHEQHDCYFKVGSKRK